MMWHDSATFVRGPAAWDALKGALLSLSLSLSLSLPPPLPPPPPPLP